MSKPKYKRGIEFFENILNDMNIDGYSVINNDEWLLYNVNFTTVSKKVLFTDEYMITVDFINNIKELLTSGDCIYLMGNWQKTTPSAEEYASSLGIKIGGPAHIKRLIYAN